MAAYDVLRIFRRIVPHSKGIVNSEDILFWVGASVFIFQVIYRLNDGNIRGFGILCMVVGMLLYQFFAKIVKKGLKKALRPFKMRIQGLSFTGKPDRSEENHESRPKGKTKC